jgi:hypothetical protein
MIAVITFLLLLVFLNFAIGQSSATTQTLRGRVADAITQTPLIGVSIRLDIDASDDRPKPGTVTDEDGNFRMPGVAVGRHTVTVSYIGYESQTIHDIVVSSGKEVVLTIDMTEQAEALTEVVIAADAQEDKSTTNNDLVMVSGRSFNPDDTKRYAGAIGDPSRMAANFAGVVGGNDARNDIVVRGNSPTGMLWQMEGLNIPNPNHFGSLVSTGGPVSMLNPNTLAKSDFLTGAFPAQYGNATAGVFDIRLRKGNNEQRELMGQIGFNGFEFGAEGPISKGSKASYVVNYRYSTLGVFKALGLDIGTGNNTPIYQDLNFKLSFPTSRHGTFSVFGLGGLSRIDLLGSEADLDGNNDLYGSENVDSYPRYKTGIAGVAYEANLSPRTYARLVAGIAYTHESLSTDSLVRNDEQEVMAKYLRNEGRFTTGKYAISFLTRTKFNRRNSLTSGMNVDITNADLFQRDIYANVMKDTTRLDVNDRSMLYQFHTTWKHRFNAHWSFQTGVHAQYFDLNKQWAVEPRAAVQFIPGSGRHTISLGYGLLNQAQALTTLYAQTKDDDKMLLTNLDLGFTTSHQLIASYEWFINERLHLKAETYYQALSNIPVEQSRSSYAAINSGISFGPVSKDSLVNNGSGYNYGLELTLERFFDKGYYFLLTSSLFNSKYQGSDRIERNTAYNTQYALNILGGKEWSLRKGMFLSASLKVTTIGGPYLTPLDMEASQAVGYAVYDESKAYSERQRAYFRTDLKIALRHEMKKSTMEFSMDFQNITNSKNVFAQTYNARTNSMTVLYQQPFFPVPYFRLTF